MLKVVALCRELYMVEWYTDKVCNAFAAYDQWLDLAALGDNYQYCTITWIMIDVFLT